jgi:hypothetical protein
VSHRFQGMHERRAGALVVLDHKDGFLLRSRAERRIGSGVKFRPVDSAGMGRGSIAILGVGLRVVMD